MRWLGTHGNYGRCCDRRPGSPPAPESLGFWNKTRFWITLCLLALEQWPLAIAAQPVIEKSSSLNMLTFGTIDGLLVIAVIFLAF